MGSGRGTGAAGQRVVRSDSRLHGSLFLLAASTSGCIGRHLCVDHGWREERVICIGTVRARHTLLSARGRRGGMGARHATAARLTMEYWLERHDFVLEFEL
jgi:hypothetical protein